tara:strand:+ start:20464 stop:20769 length:306 start_codon:yes stop_codon:yes gene_type:complete
MYGEINFNKIRIANSGKFACHIMAIVRRLAIKTVAVCADAHGKHVQVTNFLDPLFYCGLVVPTTFVSIRSRGEPDESASPPYRHPPTGSNFVNQRAFASRP